MILKTTSILTVLDKIYRDLNIQGSSRDIDIIEWCAEAIETLGYSISYISKCKVIEVCDYRAALPCDISELEMVVAGETGNGLPMLKSATLAINVPSRNYTVNGNWIKVSFRTGHLFIRYKGLQTDEDGYPLIPDDVSYKEALMWYCTKKLILGGLTSLAFPNTQSFLVFAEAKWDRYAGLARGRSLMPDIATMESIKRQWTRIIPQMNRFDNKFSNLNTNEHSP